MPKFKENVCIYVQWYGHILCISSTRVEIHTGGHMCSELKVPMGFFTTTCLKMKMVVFLSECPPLVSWRRRETFERTPSCFTYGPFHSTHSFLAFPGKSQAAADSCLTLTHVWYVWVSLCSGMCDKGVQFCDNVWRCLQCECVFMRESVCMCVLSAWNKHSSMKLSSTKTLSTNLLNTTLKFCLSLRCTTTVGKYTVSYSSIK